MSYEGKTPNYTKLKLNPQSSDPSNPAEGELQYADGTVRSEGVWVYKNGSWNQVGSNGSVIVNYIANPSADSDTSGWSTYADAAAATPVDGTGGSPNVTWTRSTTTPLRGNADFNFTKDAANRQGQGVNYDFTIDPADKSKTFNINADMEVVSGTYANGDLKFFIYDLTNASIITPSNNTINTTSVPQKLSASFTTASNSTSYRLIIHVASTSASAYVIAFDNFYTGPVISSSPTSTLGNWTSYTPTFGGLGTVSSIDCWYRQDGQNYDLKLKFTCGTVTASTVTISLPNSNVVSASVSATISAFGFGAANATSTAGNTILVLGTGSSGNLNLALTGSGNASLTAQTGTQIFSNNAVVSLFASVPIDGL
jgi:hypothetical protein